VLCCAFGPSQARLTQKAQDRKETPGELTAGTVRGKSGNLAWFELGSGVVCRFCGSSYCICTYFCTAKVALRTQLSRVSIATHGRSQRTRVPCRRYPGFRWVGACGSWPGRCAASVPARLLVWRCDLSAIVVPSAKRMAWLGAVGPFYDGERLSGVRCVVGYAPPVAWPSHIGSAKIIKASAYECGPDRAGFLRAGLVESWDASVDAYRDCCVFGRGSFALLPDNLREGGAVAGGARASGDHDAHAFAGGVCRVPGPE